MNFKKWLRAIWEWIKSLFGKEPEPIPPIPIPPIPVPPEPLPPIAPFIACSAYGLIRYELADIEAFLKGIHDAGGNATEIFLCFSWNDGWKWSPYKRISWRKEGTRQFPYFDLDQWDDAVWEKWRAIFALCKKYSLALFVRLLDYGSYDDLRLKDYYCWYSCKQRFEAQPQLPHFWQNAERSKPYLKRLAQKAREELDTAGIVYRIVPVNEHWSRADDPAKAEARAILIHSWWIQIFKDIGLPAEWVILNPAPAHEEGHLKAYGKDYTLEYHRINSDTALKAAIDLAAKYEAKIFPNGDGADRYALGDADDNGRRQASLVQAQEMRRLLTENGLDYGFKPRHKCPAGQNFLRLTKFDVLKALAGR